MAMIFNRKELKEIKASDFKEGELIICGIYRIKIVYCEYALLV